MSSPPISAATRHTVVTPPSQDLTLHKRLTVEKGVVDELLLVCGVIGSTEVLEGEETFIPVADCLNWLQDLQRALRRDDDAFRPISLLLWQWKVVPQKLLPLLLSCRYDTAIVLTVVKILVILTKPLSEAARKAGRHVIQTSSNKISEQVIQEQIKLRENALAQSEMLLDYQRLVVSHSHHHQSTKKEEGGLCSILISLLAEPLSKTGTARTAQDHLAIELVLHLFRNLLSASPIMGSKEHKFHDDLILLLEQEVVLELFLVLAQDMERRENAQYNLLLMELLHHLLKHQDPTAVARSVQTTPPSLQSSSKNSLAQQLQREKAQLRPVSQNNNLRHGHFGGTLVQQRPNGQRTYVAATHLGQPSTSRTRKRRKNKKTDPFIGATSNSQTTTSRASLKAQQTLHNFLTRFLQDCYGPLVKSLKNEFRRDSVRLEEGDKVVFFRLVWFMSKWYRATQKTQSSSLGQLIFTMDVFTFSMVLHATDTYHQHKKYAALAQTVALYQEMMQLLWRMYHSSDKTEHVMALGLMDRLFYAAEPLERLGPLLSRWQPGLFTRAYLCDLVEVVHVSLKLLETNAPACLVVDDDSNKKDAVARMKQAAADFDVPHYVRRKIVSNHTLTMVTHLLSQFRTNPPQVNHHIVALLLRFSRHQVAASEQDEDTAAAAGGEAPKNKLALKNATLEPMLYNIQLIMVLNQILNEESIQKDKDYQSLIGFAASILSRFATQAQANPMLHVECLFRHPVPHRFCELTTNMYVNEELRMIAVRELLLEEQRKLLEREEELEGEPEEEEQGVSSDRELASEKGEESASHPSEAAKRPAQADLLSKAGMEKRQRLTRHVLEDSSDEEEFEFDDSAAPTQPRSTVLEDDDSDDDNN